MNILYLHGLGSSGQSKTAQQLKELGYNVTAPDYQPEFMEKSCDMILKVVCDIQPDLIIGSSMGGYYALKLCETNQVPVIAINPCFSPKTFLNKYLTEPAVNWQTGELIEITEEMLQSFEIPKPLSHPIVLTGLRDDLIDPNRQIDYCRENNLQNISFDWGHRVEDVGQLQDIIESILPKTNW